MALRLALATAALALCAASAAQACSPAIPTPRPGQTLEQAFDEMFARADAALWRRAPIIYRARVVKVERLSRFETRYTFAPVAAVKGGQPPHRLSWTPHGAACESYDGRVGDTAIIFAMRNGLHGDARRWGAWRVLDAWVEEPTGAAARRAARAAQDAAAPPSDEPEDPPRFR